MRAFYAAETARHDPHHFTLRGRVVANEDRPERADRLLDGLARVGLRAEAPPAAPRTALGEVHSPRYLAFLEGAAGEWAQLEGASAEVIANAQPRLARATYPSGIVGRAGWHLADMASPIGPHTYAAAVRAVDTALAAADAVADGAARAYALCRPPGHHAGRETAGGHCFLNNAAAAAATLARRGARPAILDIDVHHGNGTQSIFYARGDVLTVSVHADPARFYPWFWGHAHEGGVGEGEGANLNLPLPLGTDDAAWLEAIAVALDRVAAFGADTLVLSLGLDVHASDPLGGMSVTTEGIARAGERVATARLPTVVVQEGGYLSDALGDNLAAFLGGLAGGPIPSATP
ncbi:histone deacetylase family protein [Acuticoccus sp.]|uniref:histone deacetylase family protein n=1 Tax=Acuticoccus sp. TaxID=1904378 RepID=UPI003B51CE13